MENIKVGTAQNVYINFPIASSGDRIGAAILDILIMLAGIFFFGLSMDTIFDNYSSGVQITVIIMFVTCLFLYDFLMEFFFGGQTFGKYILKIRVIKTDGSMPNAGDYLLRWILRPVEIWLMFGSVALAAILISGRGQRIGDMAAGTTVVKLKNDKALQSHIFKKFDLNKEVAYPEVEKLAGSDIQILFELLDVNRRMKLNMNDEINKANLRAKELLEKRLNIESDQPPPRFFHSLIRDYYIVNGRV